MLEEVCWVVVLEVREKASRWGWEDMVVVGVGECERMEG